jgi:protocatechuate 3,4-dioxygenase beta subunit
MMGQVQDNQGIPLPNATVEVVHIDGPQAGYGVVTTDSAGNYSIAGLPAGTYRVTVAAGQGYAMGDMEVIV